MALQNALREPEARRLGRKPATSRAELSRVALELFSTRGFDETTTDDIAEAAGIGRRTLFRYSASKSDLAWGDFDLELEGLKKHLDNLPSALPLVDALTSAVIEFNRFPDDELPYHRARMQLLLTVPALIAHSTLRYAAWRQVIAEYVARRENIEAASLRPQAIGWACLGASLAAYEQWLADEQANLLDLLEAAFVVLTGTFSNGSAQPLDKESS
ncbi:mycofactocin system transcriptional regulator [Homoserinimonas sp. OAct 916]|uniref:mycofactocin system transcriptional regulator n=1 Tax=Homoserinimonas sp. OAct 916 TaxID=2211450 RepID=UPI000DBE3EB3|nr:mycofactocin system transcriptional regulator [Homoserinimonas sp. OAct 916]